MEIFSPTREFRRVDLPEFGRPTIVTKPEQQTSLTVGALLGRSCANASPFDDRQQEPQWRRPGALSFRLSQEVFQTARRPHRQRSYIQCPPQTAFPEFR